MRRSIRRMRGPRGALVAVVLALGVADGPALGQGAGSGGGVGGPPPPKERRSQLEDLLDLVVVEDVPQQPPKKPRSQLEELLERAARNHPDIKVAEARLSTAAAELERARSLVMQQVLSLHYAIQAQKIAVERAEIESVRLSKLSLKGLAPIEEVDKARGDLIAAKGKLSELVSQMEHLTGKAQADTRKTIARGLAWLALQQASGRNSDLGVQGLLSETIRRSAVQGPMAERIRKALDKRLSVAVAHDATLGEVVDRLRQQHPDLIIQVKDPGREAKVILSSLTDVPLGAALQALEDSLTGYRIVVREYGLLIVRVADLPPGAVPLVEFWKGTSKDTAKKPR